MKIRKRHERGEFIDNVVLEDFTDEYVSQQMERLANEVPRDYDAILKFASAALAARKDETRVMTPEEIAESLE